MNITDEEYDVSKMLPQKEPFKFVNTIEAFNNRSSEIITKQTFERDSWFFKGHFPGKPIVPGVLLTECMAQSGLLLLSLRENKPVKMGYLIETRKMKFHRLVHPDETLHIQIKFDKRVGNYCFVSGCIKNQIDKICVKGDLVLFLSTEEN